MVLHRSSSTVLYMTYAPPILRWSCAALALFVAGILSASVTPQVRVNRIVFDRIGNNDGWRARIELSATGATSPAENRTARGSRFLDDLVCSLRLSFESVHQPFVFFESHVEIVCLEQGQTYTLDFYLPGEVVRRDQLSTEPFAYLLSFEVAGTPQAFVPRWASSNLQSPSAREALIRHCAAVREQQLGILVPSYHAPPEFTLRERVNRPPFRRIPVTTP